MRPGLHAFLAVLLAELALLTSQFQVGCDGECTGWKSAVAVLTVPLVLAWLVIVTWGVVRIVRTRLR